MKLATKLASLVVIGFLVGAPVGYMFANLRTEVTAATRNPDSMSIRLPKDFFANLPLAEDGQHRLVKVETFTLTGPGGNGTETGDIMVLPRFEIASLTERDK